MAAHDIIQLRVARSDVKNALAALGNVAYSRHEAAAMQALWIAEKSIRRAIRDLKRQGKEVRMSSGN